MSIPKISPLKVKVNNKSGKNVRKPAKKCISGIFISTNVYQLLLSGVITVVFMSQTVLIPSVLTFQWNELTAMEGRR